MVNVSTEGAKMGGRSTKRPVCVDVFQGGKAATVILVGMSFVKPNQRNGHWAKKVLHQVSHRSVIGFEVWAVQEV